MGFITVTKSLYIENYNNHRVMNLCILMTSIGFCQVKCFSDLGVLLNNKIMFRYVSNVLLFYTTQLLSQR